MKISVFDTHRFEKGIIQKVNDAFKLDLNFLEARLTAETARLAEGSQVVCSFANDKVDRHCIEILSSLGVELIALRSAGFNHVDLAAAEKKKILVCRVPGYSPYSVAEFAVGLLLSLNRKIHRAYGRVRELNFSLDGLVGFDLHGKTVGVVGTGRIGKIFAQIMCSFGCRVLATDLETDADLLKLGVEYVPLKELGEKSDVVSLHIPLTPQTRHIIDDRFLFSMKDGAYIINTGRGALIDAKALIYALKKEKVGGAALDVYEEEEDVFFHDLSDRILQDDYLARLLTFPNVLVTSHQAFLTREALTNIATTTLENISQFQKTKTVPPANRVKLP